MDPVVGPVHGDEALAEIAQGGLARGSDVLFGHHHPDRPALLVDHLAVANLVLHLAQGMDAKGIAAHAQLRLLGHLDLGEQGARRRIPAGELDAGCFRTRLRPPSHPTRYCARSDWPSDSSTSTPVSSCAKARHLSSAIERHCQLADPAGEDALDVVLPQPEPVGVARGKVADVQGGPGERSDLHRLPLREEPIDDSTLIEDLDRARVQTTRARAGEVLAGAPVDDGNVDSRQRQLARQHQPCRAASGDHHRMLGHGHTPVVILPL